MTAWNPLSFLRTHPAEWRQALRVVIAVATTLIAINLLNVPQGYWAVITAVIVVQTSIGGSLKAALDAAHGHAHNEDGSEISAGQQKTNAGGQPTAHADHDHEEAHSPFWMIVSGVLFVLLLAVSIRRRTASASADETSAGRPKGE